MPNIIKKQPKSLKKRLRKLELKTVEQVLDLSEDNPYLIQLLKSQEISDLTDDQIKGLTPDQVSWMTIKQIQALKSEQIQCWDEWQIQALKPTQIDALTITQIQPLKPDQVSWMTIEEIQALNKWQIQCWDEWQILWLRKNPEFKTVEQVLDLSTVNPYLITYLSKYEIKVLTADQIAALTSGQIAALTPGQIDALIPRQIKALKPEQISWLKSDQIEAMTEGKLKVLKAEQLMVLKAEQLMALQEWQIHALRENPEFKTVEQVLDLSKTNPCLIRCLGYYEMQTLTEVQLKGLIINILIKSYNSSDKTLENFQEKLGEYSFLGVINPEDSRQAFDFIHSKSKGKNSTAEKFEWLKEFIQRYVTQISVQQELNAEKPATCWTSSICTTTQLSPQR
jgi:hypothetical protein